MGFQPLQPFERGVAAVQQLDRHDLLEQRAAGRHVGDAVLPRFGGEAEDGSGELALRHHRLVVGDDARAQAGADPGPVLRRVDRRHLLQRVVVQRGEHGAVGERDERRALLGIEDVGGRGVALLDELVGELAAAALADVHPDAGRAAEDVDQRARRLLVLAIVEGERLACRPCAADRRPGQRRAAGRPGACLEESATVEVRHEQVSTQRQARPPGAPSSL
ncbi:MAG: hypothetical protein BGN94_08660 [Rhizobiales bacterium 68-8]|nr:MAG: hypothetical protein BGN94_08660 [Rhizobiales bacterium 68-8]